MAKEKKSSEHGKGALTGRDYSEDRYRNPVASGESFTFGTETGKTIYSPNGTTFDGAKLPIHDNYDELWKGE
jgi:hypothetical protein